MRNSTTLRLPRDSKALPSIQPKNATNIVRLAENYPELYRRSEKQWLPIDKGFADRLFEKTRSVVNRNLEKEEPALARRELQFLDFAPEQASRRDILIRIQQGRRDWWQRSRSPRALVSTPAHGFVLCVVSQRVNFAEPNELLRQFSQELLGLWGCRSTIEPQGQVHWEELFLENPKTETYVRFEFSVDFFAAAGDGRWWQDHRIPGGVAFTANSVGHMRRYREWYEGKPDQETWLLETAMGTIARAANTKYGQATWLRQLVEGRPYVPEVACPVLHPKANLTGYDWTRYRGHLHTDHAVRPEFFRVAPEKPPEAKLRNCAKIISHS